MYEKVFSNPDIYNVYIPLPDNPLKNLNCYIIKTDERNLIVDTGFNKIECLEALMESIKELRIDLNKTDIFATHLHSDHTGLIGDLINDNKNMRVYMGEVDYNYLKALFNYNFWEATELHYISEGFSLEQMVALRKTNPAKICSTSSLFPATLLNDGDKIKVGNFEFTCVFTPGHTPGHICLYYEKAKLMFLGDHILFDITPNICWWKGFDNSLATYLRSLKKIKDFDIEVPLPAHRTASMNVAQRVNGLIVHHAERLKNTLDIIYDNPGMNSYEIASKMKWSMRGRAWEDFPLHQRWFAVGETIAHIYYLLDEKKLKKKMENGVNRYYTV